MMAKVHKVAKDWREGSKRNLIAIRAEAGLSKQDCYRELAPMVQNGSMVFRANIGGSRSPKGMAEQLTELKNEIGRVYALLGRAKDSKFDTPEVIPQPQPDEIPANGCDDCGKVKPLSFHEASGLSLCDSCADARDDAPKSSGKERIKKELLKFLAEVRRLRTFCENQARLSEPVDFLSMRPVQAAARLIPAGIPADALLVSMTMHWPEDTRRSAGISPFDFVKLSAEIMRERGIDPNRRIVTDDGEDFGKPHKLFGYVLVLAECRQPVFLVGPHGTGKSHIAKQVAAFLGSDYGETPMTSGATRGDLLGRFTASPERPFIAARFDEIYGNGGVFCFEEIDASDPGLLIVLNNALAQNTFYNSNSGEKVERHETFMAFASGNTFGLGATKDYNARERLDAATLDRWRMGRVWVDLDENIEESILHSWNV